MSVIRLKSITESQAQDHISSLILVEGHS